jgi:hypothetical protein
MDSGRCSDHVSASPALRARSASECMEECPRKPPWPLNALTTPTSPKRQRVHGRMPSQRSLALEFTRWRFGLVGTRGHECQNPLAQPRAESLDRPRIAWPYRGITHVSPMAWLRVRRRRLLSHRDHGIVLDQGRRSLAQYVERTSKTATEPDFPSRSC